VQRDDTDTMTVRNFHFASGDRAFDFLHIGSAATATER
jgi:hypothetical protein